MPGKARFKTKRTDIKMNTSLFMAFFHLLF